MALVFLFYIHDESSFRTSIYTRVQTFVILLNTLSK